MDDDTTKEKYIKNNIEPISLETTEKIIYQMKNNVCRINVSNGNKGTGFLCKIPYPDKNNLLKVLITNNHVINEAILEKDKKIIISINNNQHEIKLENRIKYTNKKYDITMIEIKENEDKINNYLELDENIIENGSNIPYLNESIYILQYPGNNTVSVSYGILKGVNLEQDFTFWHLCSTDKGSSGSPILNILNNKVIGIHIGADNTFNYNKATFLNYPIKDFISQKINEEKSLKEFNEKYNININDNIDELDLSNKNIGNEGLKILSGLNISNIHKLYLYKNDIIDINSLEKVNFEKLEILSLGYNKISDINIFEKIKFKELKELYLNDNNISNIDKLENLECEKLEILSLGHNKIEDISVLEKMNLKELKELYLYENNIIDINVFENVKFIGLEKLNLRNNKIANIHVFQNLKFKSLKELKLSNNNIIKDNYASLINSLNSKVKDFKI